MSVAIQPLQFPLITLAEMLAWHDNPARESTEISRGGAPEGYLEVWLFGWPGRDFIRYITFEDYQRYDEAVAEKRRQRLSRSVTNGGVSSPVTHAA